MKIAVIGAGLAGCAAAYVLKQNGADVIVYEAGDAVAPGASGNALGLYNPRIAAEQAPQSMFYQACFEKALEVFAGFEDIEWNRCGALHLITDEKREVRYRKAEKNWDYWHLVNVAEASKIAGVEVGYEALYIPNSGSVSPRKLCAAYLEGIEVRLNTKVENLAALEADAVILACGMGVQSFVDLDLRAVRGQITEVSASDVSENLKTNLCYGGYVSAARDGMHVVGSTFQRWLDHSEILPEDDVDNLAKLAEFVPSLGDMEVTGQRAAVRTTSKDHFPIVGHVQDNVYVSTAHGSHGILTSLGGVSVLADMIMGKGETLPALCPSRFKNAKTAA